MTETRRPAFPDFCGNAKLKAALSADLMGERVNHAYILEGSRGAGKHTLATMLSAAIACTAESDRAPLPCGECHTCRQILRGQSPDVIWINRGERASIGVKSIRAIREDLYTAANDTEKKVYILEEAHLMTEEAQNALLLTLEEPPAHVIFLLLTENSSLLLETIRSRAPVLRLSRLSPEEVSAYILAHDPRAKTLRDKDAGAFGDLVMSADGCIGEALALLDKETLAETTERRRQACMLVGAAVSESESRYAVLRQLPQKADALRPILMLSYAVIRDLLVAKNGVDVPMAFFYRRDEADAISAKLTAFALCALEERLSTALAALTRNVSPVLALYMLFGVDA